MIKVIQKRPLIVVVGSSSIDFVLETSKIPQANDTILASESKSFLGGKGANQAIATAKLGANVYLVSCVGMDPYGQQVIRNLDDEGVNVAFVNETDEPTGTAYVTTSKEGNAIVVIPGANYKLNKRYIDEADRFFQAADMVLIQMEIPTETINYVAEKCKKYNKKLGVYAAPAAYLSKTVIDAATFIVAKNHDIKIIFENEPVESIMKSLPNKLFLRDDANSTSYYDGSEMKYFRENPENMVNKMGMGDAFTSGFAIAYLHQNDIETCVKFGNKIALHVANQLDSQKGLPSLKEVK
ncbi:PfkB family carbohydrate kinase [Chryseobacterium sp. POL2]|uniref:PfkB family carbohydrate kinase n=1 Tax=Chryseobacterium sp. POL2 TaxID=2713414 RepID=UPI00293C0D3A|nr:PfkB family carbohydrate kinase [Chryseobacterium sp. POL2]